MNKKLKFNQEKSLQVVFKLPGALSVKSFKIPIWVLVVLVSISILVVGAGFSFTYIGLKKEIEMQALKKINTHYNQEMLDYSKLEQEMDALEKTLEDLRVTENTYKRLLNRRYVKRKYKEKIHFKTLQTNIKFPNNSKEKQSLQLRLERLKYNTATLKQNYQQIVEVLTVLKSIYKTVPSITPTYGGIRSTYGYRVHPVTGKWRFHKGIDIPSWTGAPVRATADGEVETSGYFGSYGNLVILRHESGYRTYYAHLSKTLVNIGYFVEKGQLIGTVGNTGLSTGPHLHYEVRYGYKNEHASPRDFLDLDLFAALKKL